MCANFERKYCLQSKKLIDPKHFQCEEEKSKVVHSRDLMIGPGGLRAPCIAWPLLLPSFSLSFYLLFLRLLLLTHFGESPV